MEFEQVYDLYFRDVYRYILKLSGSEHVAEEITSDTFFKAFDVKKGDKMWLDEADRAIIW